MKYLLILITLAGIFLYINRSYAYFYDFQGSHFIVNPFYPPKLEFNPEKKSEPMKLVVMGDSLIAGTGSTSHDKSLSYLIAQNLAGENNLTLINTATPGVGIEDVLDIQLPETIAEKPDYVILMIGVNDVHNRKSEEFFRNKYKQVLDQLTAKTNSKITLINIPYAGSDNILYPPWNKILELRTQKFNEIINELALERQIKVIDIYGEFKDQFIKTSDLYGFDEFHPSDKGYALWANFINKFVVSQ